MRFPTLLAVLALAAACDRTPLPPTDTSDAAAPARIVGHEAGGTSHVDRMKAIIRRDAATSYGEECGTIAVPDRAFIPVEVTGGGLPELAVSFNRVECGIGRTRFSGTGGVMVQFWIGSGGPVRLLLEQQMHGFTPMGDRLATLQHGARCPGGAGPDACLVTYAWNDQDRRFDVVGRNLASEMGEVPRMRYDYELLSR